MRFHFAIVALALLSGCATIGGPDYWYPAARPVTVAAVIESASLRADCNAAGVAFEGSMLWGCFAPRTRTIYLQQGMLPALRACVLRHEQHHAEGYSHRGAAVWRHLDCGDGTFWSQG